MKKKLVQINTVCNNSTGRIMGDIQRCALKHGYDAISFVGRRKAFTDIRCEKIGNGISFWTHVAINTVFDRQGYGSYFVTRKMIKRIKEENPDIIHLHNLHGYYLNLPLLFDYLGNEFQGQIFWTFHDCWPFTGHCPHFVAAGCDKWRTQCHNCPCKTQYPISFFLDSSRKNYQDKKRMICSLKNLTIITPSEWMKRWIKDSFVGQYPIHVISNGIDLDKFSYRVDNNVLDKYSVPSDKKIILGVASVWDQRKGLKDFMELADSIGDDYCIVLVGLNRKQIKKLKPNMVGIERTDNQDEIAVLYSAADIFVNPSVEESFSLVTVEAFACGTPVIVLDTSAVKELVNENNGVVLQSHTTADYLKAIQKLENESLSRDRVAATARKYELYKNIEKCVALYDVCSD